MRVRVAVVLGMLMATGGVGRAGAAKDDGKGEEPKGPAALVVFGEKTERPRELEWSRAVLRVTSADPKAPALIQAVGNPVPIGTVDELARGGAGAVAWGRLTEAYGGPACVPAPVVATVRAFADWLRDCGREGGLYIWFTGKLDEPEVNAAITLAGPQGSEAGLFPKLAAAEAGIDVYAPAAGAAVTLEPCPGIPTAPATTTDASGHAFLAFPNGLCAGEYRVTVKGIGCEWVSKPFLLTPPQMETERYLVVLGGACKEPVPVVVARAEKGEAGTLKFPDVVAFRQRWEFRTGVGQGFDGEGAGAYVGVDSPWQQPRTRPQKEGSVCVFVQPVRVYTEGHASDFVDITARGTVKSQAPVDLSARLPRWGLSVGALLRENNPGGLGGYWVFSAKRDLRLHVLYAFVSDEGLVKTGIVAISFPLVDLQVLFPKP